MSDNIAIEVHKKSIEYAMAGNKDAWLSLFADDAIVRDPVGPSLFDPEGQGHRGKPAIEAFWDTVIGPSNINIEPIQRVPSGPFACAVLMTATNAIAEDMQTTIKMIATYEVNDEGKLIALSAHWDWNEMEEQLKALGLM